MCTIAGYLGDRPAAPVLLGMMRFLEGFNNAHFSGIATTDGRNLDSAKVVGNVETLCRETAAADFPGEAGIIHSRPDMKGDREWAHPFLDRKGNFAYLANGHGGFLEIEGRDETVFRRMKEQGRVFLSAPDSGTAPGNVGQVHGSELHCRLIEEQEEKTGCLEEGFFRALMEMPQEIACLVLDRRRPGEILAGRFNQPLMVGRRGREVFLATTAMAFPPDLEWTGVFPAAALGVIDREWTRLRALAPLATGVASIFPWSEAESAMERLLREKGACTIQDFKDATAALWPAGQAPQKDLLVYEVVRRWKSLGRVTFDVEAGVKDGVGVTLSKIRFR